MSGKSLKMSSNRPYLLRAFYQWLLDNGMTPQILVDAQLPSVKVPQHFVKDGQIILNISPSAVSNFTIENASIEFQARFSGSPFQLYIPMVAVMAIFARENGEGMAFSKEEYRDDYDPDSVAPSSPAEIEKKSRAVAQTEASLVVTNTPTNLSAVETTQKNSHLSHLDGAQQKPLNNPHAVKSKCRNKKTNKPQLKIIK